MTSNISNTTILLVEDLHQQRLPARRLAAVLRQAGLSVRLARFSVGDDPAPIITLAQREQPRLIIFSILFAHLLSEYLALATQLRAAGIASHLTMVGPLPTFAYADLLANCPALDSVLRGEAESSIVQLAKGLSSSSLKWESVPGLAYRSPAIQTNPLPQSALNLDDLPFPARDDGISFTQNGWGYATVEASRGCYHACTFCLPCAFYRAGTIPRYRLRSIPNLLEEIETLYQQGARLFLFDDEQFLPPGRTRQARVQSLSEELEQRGLDIAFTIKCRADDVDETLFRQLKGIGLVRVYLGVESGCQASLDLYGKETTAAGNAQALACLSALDIVADFRSLLFHPWSTLETIQADIEFLNQVLPYVATPYTFREVECYPGTPLGKKLLVENSPCKEPSWLPAYTINDPRAELLRRLARIVFSQRDTYAGVHNQITQAWYNHLLQHRFEPERSQVQTLCDTVVHLNRETLIIWREILAFAGKTMHTSDLINKQAADWACRANTLDMMIETKLT